MVNSSSDLLTIAANLKRNRFKVILAKDGKEAKDYTLELIPQHSSVGIANSVTVRQLGIIEALRQRGDNLVDPISMTREPSTEFGQEAFMSLMRKSLETDVFISGTNAITQDGKLVNIDGLGNRVAGMIWAKGKVLIIAGRNKIAGDVDDAIKRIKMIVPVLARRREMQVPCVKAGKCVDCNVAQRPCNVILILEKRPSETDITVILVDEDLGMGWNPAWPLDRIEQIKRRYENFDWPRI
jgi:L-lactate utilization protein LutB